MPAVHAPARGDLVWLDFDPRSESEQSGRRPALVISPKAYNRKVGLALVCPITSQAKGYPFEVGLPAGVEAHGVILCDQIKSLDWRARSATYFGSVPSATTEEVTARLLALVDPDEEAR